MSEYCREVSGPYTGNIIEDRLNEVMAFGNQAYDEAIAALNQITTLFTQPEPVGYDPGAVGSTIVGSYGINIPEFVKPKEPTLDTPEMEMPDEPGLPPDVSEQIPDEFLGTRSLSLMDDMIDTLVAKYNTALDRCSVSAQLCATLIEFMDGNLGLPPDVVQAMRDRAYSSEDLAAIAAEKQVMDEWGARGFTQPAGVLDAKLLLVKQQYYDKRAEINRTILIEEEKFALETRRFGVQQAVAYENFLRDQYIKLFDTARESVKAAFGFNLETAKLNLEEWSAQLERFKVLLEGEIARIRSIIDVSNGQVNLYQALTASEKAFIDTEVEENRLTLQKAQIEGNLAMQSMQLEQQKILAEAQITVDGLKGIAQVGSQLAAGALSALHMSAGISTDTRYSNSSDCNTTYSVNVS